MISDRRKGKGTLIALLQVGVWCQRSPENLTIVVKGDVDTGCIRSFDRWEQMAMSVWGFDSAGRNKMTPQQNDLDAWQRYEKNWFNLTDRYPKLGPVVHNRWKVKIVDCSSQTLRQIEQGKQTSSDCGDDRPVRGGSRQLFKATRKLFKLNLPSRNEFGRIGVECVLSRIGGGILRLSGRHEAFRNVSASMLGSRFHCCDPPPLFNNFLKFLGKKFSVF